ncbi:hypothetical protein [Amycolatopsis sp. NPDC051903]|uniref:hypothetical protein n=1 Tax=Amycolatopsis sp. NPDC051903 TaxID=3363936 RepID=UPI0037978473
MDDHDHPSGQAPAWDSGVVLESLPKGTGTPVRWLGAAVLVLAGLGVPFAALGWAVATPGPASAPPTLGAGAVLRALSPYAVLVLGFVVAFHRRPSVWATVLGWAGVLLGLELLASGAIETALGTGAGWRALVTAPVAVVWAYGCGRLARVVLNRPLGRDLAAARTEVAVRLTDGWLLVQADRVVRGAPGKLGGPTGRGPGMPYRELAHAQLGRAGDQPVLRLAGDQRQWLLELRDPHPEQVLELVVARAGRAGPAAAESRGSAESDVRAGTTAMRGGVGLKGPGFVLVVAIVCLAIAVLSFFPDLTNVVFTGSSSHTNVAGGIVFGLIGLVAAHKYRRYRRGLRSLQNQSGEAVGQHLAARWAAVTPERATTPRP